MIEAILTELSPTALITMKALDETLPKTNAMSYTDFGAFICMLLEEWCCEHEQDIKEVITDLSNVILEVNSMCGTYQRAPLS